MSNTKWVFLLVFALALPVFSTVSPTPGKYNLIGLLVSDKNGTIFTVNAFSNSALRIHLLNADQLNPKLPSVKYMKVIDGDITLIRMTGPNSADGNLNSWKVSTVKKSPIYDSNLKPIKN